MKLRIIILGAIVLGTLSTVAAQTTTPAVTTTQIEQQGQIIQGQVNGELTKQETRRLERQQRRIARHKHDAKADGKVSRREARKLRKEQMEADKNIYRKTNDPKKN
ncbi:MAG: hypothetical protein ABJB16_18465 [Saprospiraceae bacterium]